MKVFYITTFDNSVFYVRAPNAEAAKEHLTEQVKKYFFKRELAADDNMQAPPTLGADIIVEMSIRKGITDSNEKMVIEDITAMAYVFSEAGKTHWKDWTLSVNDVMGD